MIADYTRPILEHRETVGHIRSINLNMINHFASQSQTCQILKIIFYVKRKLRKVMQSHFELLRINFKFEAPILQEQIIRL